MALAARAVTWGASISAIGAAVQLLLRRWKRFRSRRQFDGLDGAFIDELDGDRGSASIMSVACSQADLVHCCAHCLLGVLLVDRRGVIQLKADCRWEAGVTTAAWCVLHCIQHNVAAADVATISHTSCDVLIALLAARTSTAQHCCRVAGTQCQLLYHPDVPASLHAAAARAIESMRADALFIDPFAKLLAGPKALARFEVRPARMECMKTSI